MHDKGGYQRGDQAQCYRPWQAVSAAGSSIRRLSNTGTVVCTIPENDGGFCESLCQIVSLCYKEREVIPLLNRETPTCTACRRISCCTWCLTRKLMVLQLVLLVAEANLLPCL